MGTYKCLMWLLFKSFFKPFEVGIILEILYRSSDQFSKDFENYYTDAIKFYSFEGYIQKHRHLS